MYPDTAYELTISTPHYPAFATSVWINDKFISTTSGGQETNALYTFPEGSVKKGEDNVITVIQDNMGNDEDPTGIFHGFIYRSIAILTMLV